MMVSESFDPILIFKNIKKFVFKPSDNQYKTSASIAKQLLILSFRQDIRCQTQPTMIDLPPGWKLLVREESATIPNFLDTKCVELSCTKYDALTPAKQKNVRDIIKQEYLAYLFINNSNQKLHSQLKKEVANNYLKGNMEAYLSDIHEALTIMNEYAIDIGCCTRAHPRYAFATTVVKAKGRKLPVEPSTLATPTGRQQAQKLRLRSSTSARKQQRMMTMRNLLSVQSQQKQ